MPQPGTAEVEPRAVAVARAAQRRDQGQRLHDDPERGADAEEADLAVGHAGRGRGAAVGHGQEDQAGHDHDQVVQDRGEHHRPEPAARVEDLAEHHVQPVEEDLRQEEAGERHRHLEVGVRVAPGERGRVRTDDQRRGEHGRDRDDDQDDPDGGEQPVGERLAAVRVVAHRLDELRHEDRVERAAREQDVEDVRDRVGDVVRLGEDRRPDRPDQHDVADEAGEAGHDRPDRHDRAGPADAAAVLRRGRRGRGVELAARHGQHDRGGLVRRGAGRRVGRTARPPLALLTPALSHSPVGRARNRPRRARRGRRARRASPRQGRGRSPSRAAPRRGGSA